MTVKSIQIVTKMEFEVLAKYCKRPLEYRTAEWLEAQSLAQRVWGLIPLFGQHVKSEKPFRK